jgi:hypothetical protein
VAKSLRWIFNGLIALSLLLFLAIAAMWMIANSGYGLRVLCLVTRGGTLWRIRLDNPDLGRISRFAPWPSTRPARFALRYVASGNQSPINVFSPPRVEFTPTRQPFANDDFDCLSGPVAVPIGAIGSPPLWDAPVILVNQPNPVAPPGSQSAANCSLTMISYSYIWAMEIFGALPLLKLFMLIRRAIAAKAQTSPGFCANCGYDLRATPDRCPECGAVPKNRPDTPPV